MKKILVLGANGQLGREVVRLFSLEDKSKYECIAPDEYDADITNFDRLLKITKDFSPDAIVNCAAYTNVDKAEIEQDKAYYVNVCGAENIARCALATHSLLIHISTDYVYDGNFNDKSIGFSHMKHKSHERPLNVYGLTKLNGEKAIKERISRTSELASNDYFILRTSGLYGIYGNNFLKKLESALENDKDKHLTLIADQRYCPTSARQLARQIKAIVDLSHEDRIYVIGRVGNVLNAASLTCESPYLFFEKYLLLQKKYDLVNRISPISFDEYFKSHNEIARRPRDCPLDIELNRILGICYLTSTTSALEEYIGAKKELEA